MNESSEHSRSPGSGKFLFPAVGTVAGVLAFAVLYFLLPDFLLPDSTTATVPGPAGASLSDPQRSGPIPVRGLKAVAGNHAVAVSWTSPSDAQVGSYVAEAMPEDARLPTGRCTTAEQSCVINGLTNGAAYTIEVRSENKEGARSAPQQALVTPRPDILVSESSALWLDADDVSTVGDRSGAAGAPASEWHDKSGRGYVATQSNTATQPLIAVVGKHHALKFSGSQNLAFDDSRLPSGSESSTVIVVVRLDDQGAAKSCYEHVLAWGSAQRGAARVLHKGCYTLMAYAETFDTFATMNPTKAWPVGKLAILSATITKSSIDVWMNGSLSYSWTAPADAPTITASRQTFMVGGASWWGTAAGWIGLIGEVVVLAGEVSAADRKEVEQYLVRKWSIT